MSPQAVQAEMDIILANARLRLSSIVEYVCDDPRLGHFVLWCRLSDGWALLNAARVERYPEKCVVQLLQERDFNYAFYECVAASEEVQ